jgi:CRISPR/Cas system-associated exonuclease Cas4 (RecB family)
MGYSLKNLLKMITAIILVLLLNAMACSDTIDKGKGVFQAGNYSFSCSVPKGWIIDDKNGINKGLNIVLYPVQNSWTDSPVIIYGDSVSKSKIATVKLQAEITMQEYKNKGSYNYKIENRLFIDISEGKKAELFYFSEDQWGNREAIAYFEEAESINYLVYNARTKEMFEKYLKDFHKIIQTYSNMHRQN